MSQKITYDEPKLEPREKQILDGVEFLEKCADDNRNRTVSDADIDDMSFPAIIFDKVTFLDSSLVKADFENSRFSYCKFVNCDLREVSFKKARFTECQFVNCLMGKVNLEGAVLLTPTMARVDLQGANLTKVYIKGAAAASVNLNACFAEDIQLYDSNFAHCLFKGTNFMRGRWYYNTICLSDMAEVNFSEVEFRFSGFTNMDLHKLDFSERKIKNLLAIECHIKECLFDRSEIDTHILSASVLEKCSFRDAKINLPQYARTTFQDCDLEGITLSGGSCAGVKVKKSLFRRGECKEVNFHESQFEDSVLEGSSFRSCDFTYSDFIRCEATEMDVTDAIFAGVKDIDVRWDGTDLKKTRKFDEGFNRSVEFAMKNKIAFAEEQKKASKNKSV